MGMADAELWGVLALARRGPHSVSARRAWARADLDRPRERTRRQAVAHVRLSDVRRTARQDRARGATHRGGTCARAARAGQRGGPAALHAGNRGLAAKRRDAPR